LWSMWIFFIFRFWWSLWWWWPSVMRISVHYLLWCFSVEGLYVHRGFYVRVYIVIQNIRIKVTYVHCMLPS
jgi:hypothetical protein